MIEIGSDIFISDREQAGQHSLYDTHEIDTVVPLTYTLPDDGYPNQVDVFQYQMMDGPRNDEMVMRRAVEKILSQLKQDKRVLVHCSAGASRSPAVAAATIALQQNQSLEDVVQELQRTHEQLTIHPSVLENAEWVVESLGSSL